MLVAAACNARALCAHTGATALGIAELRTYGRVAGDGLPGRVSTSFAVDLSSCPLIDTQPIAIRTNTTEMPSGTKKDVPRRSTDVLSLPGSRTIFHLPLRQTCSFTGLGPIV